MLEGEGSDGEGGEDEDCGARWCEVGGIGGIEGFGEFCSEFTTVGGWLLDVVDRHGVGTSGVI